MRCEDLTREIASPTGAVPAAEMAGHLADCPSCARWSRQAARFDQIWEATRPLEVSPAKLDSLWASASAALETRPTLRLEGVTPRRNWVRPVLLFAQAAAILLAIGFVATRKMTVQPIQVAQNPIADSTDIVPSNVVPSVTNVAKSDTPDIFAFPPMNLHVNEGETLFVQIPNDKSDNPKVARLDETRLDHSTLIPPGTPFDVINDAETMTGTKVSSL